METKKELYRMIQSSLLCYKKFRKTLDCIRFKINLYNPCVANRIVNKKQHMVTWHVNVLKLRYGDPKVIDKFLAWLKTKYVSDNIGEQSSQRQDP